MAHVAVIGLDGAEPELVEELMASGAMPHLARLRERSASCRLYSEANWRSGRVWETFLTGVADFPSAALFDPETYESAQLGARRKPPFYARVPDLRVLALDVPYQSLWYDVPGAQVIWGGHDAGYPRASRPGGLVRDLDARFGPHPAFHNDFACAWHHPASVDTLADALVVGARRRVEVLRWLEQRVPDWDLLMTVLSEAHSAGEMFWHGLDREHPLAGVAAAPLAGRRLREVHQVLDETLGRILAGLPEDAVVLVCSVHGMRANDYDVPSMALLPELLHRAHFGTHLLEGPDPEVWRRRGCPPVLPAPWQRWQQYMQERFGVSAAERRRLERAQNRPGWTRLRRAAWRALRGAPAPPPIERLDVPIPPETDRAPEEIDEPRDSLDWQVPCWYRTHWPRMRAFTLPAFYDARVRVNLRGRERDGIVDPADYAATLDWVEGLLAECRDARTGKPVLAKVERLRAAEPMDPAGTDADLLVTWSPGVDAFEHAEFGVVGPFPYRRTGGHTDRGFAFVAGPGIVAGDLGTRDALDLTPTVLALLGHEPPADLPGRSIWPVQPKARAS